MKCFQTKWIAAIGVALLMTIACDGNGEEQEQQDVGVEDTGPALDTSGDADAPAPQEDVADEGDSGEDADAVVEPDVEDAGEADVDADADVDEPPPIEHPVCEPKGGECFYIAAVEGSGEGTYEDPFGLADLPASDTSYCELESPAMEALQPGDVLYFRDGEYELHGCSGSYWARGYLRTGQSGTEDNPITIRAYPEEEVILRMMSGNQPGLGNAGESFVRYLGFIIEPETAAGLRIQGGQGIEVAYNEFVGQYRDTTDNHDGLRIETTDAPWVHHNIIRDTTGEGPNSAGIKVYTTNEALIEDNYIHSNTAGVYDKDSGIDNTYRRNFITGNEDYQWYGNNQGEVSTIYFYDNVIDGRVELHFLTEDSEIHDNLVRSNSLSGAWAGQTWRTSLWNNIVVTDEDEIRAYSESQNPFSNSGDERHLEYMDHNLYTAPPTYRFGIYSDDPSTFDLEDMRQMGFELQSQVADATDIFFDQEAYELHEQWERFGRDGTDPGPEDVEQVLDTDRYGPLNLPWDY